MKKLQCQSCGATLDWDGSSEVITCGSCGMRYQVRPRDPRRAMLVNALRGGCVAPRPVREGDGCGIVYFDSWLPEGWTYRYEIPDLFYRYSSIYTPLVPILHLFTVARRGLYAVGAHTEWQLLAGWARFAGEGSMRCHLGMLPKCPACPS